MKTIIFGDVHGNAQALERLFLSHGKEAQYYTVGDLIDRGPDSLRVLELCAEYGVQGVYGNHELWLLDVLSGMPFDDFALSPIMGGLATLQSFGLRKGDPDRVASLIRAQTPPAVRAFLSGLTLYRVLNVEGHGRFYLVHSGVKNATVGSNNATDLEILEAIRISNSSSVLWTGADVSGRYGGMYQFRDGVQVFGHTPLKQVTTLTGLEGKPYAIGLDTGSGTCAPFKLSALVLFPEGNRTIETY